MATIEDVKAALDIVEVVQGYVPALKRAGRSWKAPCPFHSERTPSFVVDPERRTWHCFGACSTGGDVIGFVQRVEHLEFREALQRCAQRAGIELRPPSPREQREHEVHERLLRANEAAAVFFQSQLQGPAGTAALSYAEGRGLDSAARDIWQIGYAPGEWRLLTDHLLARGFTEQDLLNAGIATRSTAESGGTAPGSGNRLYDRFRDRLMYPTRDARGRMIGFGARALKPEQEPKYLNTAQTPLFDKSGTLYGLNRAGEEARRADRMIVVEGYMDVIACHQAGIRNVVASMGTSITEKQMMLVQRYTHNVVLMLDADAAGSAAALRGSGIVEAAVQHIPGEAIARIEEMNAQKGAVDWVGVMKVQDVLKADLRVAVLPAGEDPDSLVRSDPDHLRALLNGARPTADHLFSVVEAEMDRDDPRSRSQAVETLAPTVAGIGDPVVRAHYIQRLARLGGVNEHTILAVLARDGRLGRPTAVPSQTEMRSARMPSVPPDGETQLLHLLLFRAEARDAGLALDANVFEDSTNRRLFEAWREFDDVEARVLELDDDVAEHLGALRASASGTWDPAALEMRYIAPRVAEIARRLRLRRAQSRLVPSAVAQATAVAEARRGGEGAADIDELTADFVAMDVRQRELSRWARGHAPVEDDLMDQKPSPSDDNEKSDEMNTTTSTIPDDGNTGGGGLNDADI